MGDEAARRIPPVTLGLHTWMYFLRRYLNIISDVPLRVTPKRPDSLRRITGVTMTIRYGGISADGKKLLFQSIWTTHSRDGSSDWEFLVPFLER